LAGGVYLLKASRGWIHFDTEQPPTGPLTVEGTSCKGGARPDYGSWERYDFKERCTRRALSIPAYGLIAIGGTLFVGSFFF
jgi:hypothetical protein